MIYLRLLRVYAVVAVILLVASQNLSGQATTAST